MTAREFSAQLADQLLATLPRLAPGDDLPNKIVGRLGRPSKMPGPSYGLEALATCKIGAMLAKKKDTVCSICYATRGKYVFACVSEAHRRREASIRRDPEMWAACMVVKLRRTRGEKFFRWHDSGDLLGDWHYQAIEWIARQLPEWKFWLPTKEVAVVRSATPPPNLTIRVSAFMVGGAPPDVNGLPTSTSGAGIGRKCPAPKQGGKCGDCRACWNRRIKNVDYEIH